MRRRGNEGRSPSTDDAARARLGLAPVRRPRPRILTGRGRVTILAAIAFAGVVASLAVPFGAPLLGRISDGVARDAQGLLLPPTVPDELLARLPVSEQVLQLERTDGSRPGDGQDATPPSPEAIDPAAAPRFIEQIEPTSPVPGLATPLRIEYALDANLTERVYAVLRRARVKRGHVVVLDVLSGRVIAYASADPVALPPTGAYPAASLAKVVTVAASLEHNRARALQPCSYRGDPYRLTKARVNPARGGHMASLEKALARSYNQCFAQLAVHALGEEETRRAFARFRWHASPAPGHSRGLIDRGEGVYGLGRLGSGLAGSRITALHAAQLAGSLANGEIVEPWWIDRVVDARGHALRLPARGARHRVMERETAIEVRRMLVLTTTGGTARSAFRSRRGPKLGAVRVAGKTGNLSGTDPRARYEWFAGAAPAEAPVVAVAVVQAHDQLWWKMSSEIAADVFAELFCEKHRCSNDRVARFTGDLGSDFAPPLLSSRLGAASD